MTHQNRKIFFKSLFLPNDIHLYKAIHLQEKTVVGIPSF